MHIGVIIVLPLLHFKPFVTKFGMVVSWSVMQKKRLLLDTSCQENIHIYRFVLRCGSGNGGVKHFS